MTVSGPLPMSCPQAATLGVSGQGGKQGRERGPDSVGLGFLQGRGGGTWKPLPQAEHFLQGGSCALTTLGVAPVGLRSSRARRRQSAWLPLGGHQSLHLPHEPQTQLFLPRQSHALHSHRQAHALLHVLQGTQASGPHPGPRKHPSWRGGQHGRASPQSLGVLH